SATVRNVRLVDQPALQTRGEAVLLYVDARLLGQCQCHGQRRAVRANAGDDQALFGRIVQADAAQISRQILFECAYGDLENALDILALADGACDAIEQFQPYQMMPRLSLSRSARSDVVEQDRDPGAVGTAHTIGIDVVVAFEAFGFVLEMHGLACHGNPSEGLEPMALEVRYEIGHQLSLHILQSGLRLEGRIDLEIAEVHRLARRIEDHLDGTE